MIARISSTNAQYLVIIAVFSHGSVLAHDALCPDYSHYRGILRQGQKQVDSLTTDSFRRSRIVGTYGLSNYRTVKDFVPKVNTYDVPTEEEYARDKELAKAQRLIQVGKSELALGVIQSVFDEITGLSMRNIPYLEKCDSRLAQVILKLNGVKTKQSNLEKASKLKQLCRKRIMKIECLDMAQKLSKTGWKLEKRGASKTAVQMYESVLEIREKNLSAKNELIAKTIVDLARAEFSLENYVAAKTHYEKAIRIYRSIKLADNTDLRIAMEGYASTLRRLSNNAKAQKIYLQLRSLP